MVPNYAHWLTDFRTVFVFALGPFLPIKVIFFDFNWNFNGNMAKNHFLAINLVGVCYNHLVITAELHFYTSFQGYPTFHYWSPMARWPDGHKFNYKFNKFKLHAYFFYFDAFLGPILFERFV